MGKYIFLPLCAAGFYLFVLSPVVKRVGEHIEAVSSSGQFPHGTPLRTHYLHFAPLDNVLQFFVSFFLQFCDGSTPHTTAFTAYFMLAGPLPNLVIWQIEGARERARGGLLRYPLLWNIAVQTVGFMTAAPLYFFTFFHTGSGGRATASSAMPVAEAAALLPSLCIGYLLPTALLLSPGVSDHQRQLAIAVWQFFPVWFSLTQRLLARLMAPSFQPSSPPKLGYQVYLRRTYNVMLGLSLLAHACALKFVFSTSDPLATLRDMFVPNLAPKGLAACTVALLQWDFLLGMVATLGWAAGAVWQSTRPADRSLGRALALGLGFVGGSLLASPGAVVTAAFRWREEQLLQVADKSN